MSTFVTGATGLLGAALVEALVADGEEVVVLKRDDTPRSPLALRGLEAHVAVVRGSVTDAATIERALGEYEVDVVFHLAAQTIVGTANASPVPTFEANVAGTWTVLEACRRLGVARTVVAASDKAYGDPIELPYREDMALRPRFPYDVSKAATDLVARSYWHTYGVPVATTRFANLYGPGDQNRSRLVPEACVAALAGRAPVIRSDGSPERDFLHVDDAVRAYRAIAAALADPERGGAAGEAFNAGSGVPRSVLSVVERVCALAGTGVTPDVRGTGTPAGEIDRQYVSAEKLHALTGWAPEVELDDGLRSALDWHREHG